MAWQRVDRMELAGKRVLIRVDFNVPLSDDELGRIQVADDTRIRKALPTIRHVLNAGGKTVLLSHLGRPKGSRDPALSLEPVSRRLSELLDASVLFSPETSGPHAEDLVDSLAPGEVLLLENTRFDSGETDNDPSLGKAFARLADVYINDAFGAAHRAHASTEGITHYVAEKGAGLLLDRELAALGRLLASPEKPFVALVGGAKVSDKIAVMESLLDRVDVLCVGGAMAYTFLKSRGVSVGTSLVEDDRLEMAATLLEKHGDRIRLPIDHVCAPEFAADAPTSIHADAIPEGLMGLDIGPKTVQLYSEIVRNAKTVVWNGPMGVFEMKRFSIGTVSMARALAAATSAGAFTVVGGGDSVAALARAGMTDAVSHVSTGGGAMLEFLEGRTLPGVAALMDG